MNDRHLLDWLLEGDVSVQYRVHRDLLGSPPEMLAGLGARIPLEGFGKRFLDFRQPDSIWWPGGYGPKWISTHYTLLELMNIGFPGSHPDIRAVTAAYVNGMWSGGPFNSRTKRWFDVCVAAMMVSLACHAGLDGTGEAVRTLLDYLLRTRMPDGGWNCGWWGKPGPVKSSVHTTISVLEALRDLDSSQAGEYRRDERKAALEHGAEVLLKRRIYMKMQSDEAIEPRFAKMSFPCRWRFDFLRGLEWFASVHWPHDGRMDPALDLLESKRLTDGTWTVQEWHGGRFHFQMEKCGKPSRWNTLRALRVLGVYRRGWNCPDKGSPA